MEISRRHFLRKCGFATVGLLAIRSHPLGYGFFDSADAAPFGYGPLLSDPDKILDLPRGFSYKVISRTAEPMDDGLLVPGMHDGMAAFPGLNGKTILIRNHELSPGNIRHSPYGERNQLLKNLAAEQIYHTVRRTKP